MFIYIIFKKSQLGRFLSYWAGFGGVVSKISSTWTYLQMLKANGDPKILVFGPNHVQHIENPEPRNISIWDEISKMHNFLTVYPIDPIFGHEVALNMRYILVSHFNFKNHIEVPANLPGTCHTLMNWKSTFFGLWLFKTH